jgi:hypothetical protein
MEMGKIGSQPIREFATPTATRATLFGSPGRERIWQLNGQKGTSIRTMSICLLQEPLEPMLVAPSIARRTIPETEIWRASRKSGNAVDGGGTASCCRVTSAPPGCMLLMRHEIRSGSRQYSNVEYHLRSLGEIVNERHDPKSCRNGCN